MAILLYVNFEGGHKLGKVIANKLGGQTWPGTEVSGVTHLGPSGYKRAEITVMEILDQVVTGTHFIGSASL